MKRSHLARWCGLAAACALVACAPSNVEPPAARAQAPASSTAHGPFERPTEAAPAIADQCPGTPAGAVELAHGCSAVELTRKPELLFAEALAGSDAAAQAIDDAEFAAARPKIDSAGQALRDAAAALARGEVCGAAALARRADGAANDAESALDEALARAPQAAQPSGDEPAPDALTQHTRLSLRTAVAQENLSAVHRAAATAQELCDAVAGPFQARARITRIEAQRGLAHLDDGSVVALALIGPTEHAFAGREATLSGVRFADGTALATRVDSEVSLSAPAGVDRAGKGAGEVQPMSTGSGGIGIINPPPPIYSPPCLTLQAVPIQSGYPYDGGTVWTVQHPLTGYTDASGTVQFEYGIGLTPSQNTSTYYCPTWDSATNASIVYSVSISQYNKVNTYTLASDMHDGDGVVFPTQNVYPWVNSTITATFYQRECKWFAGLTTCTTPTVLRTEQYNVNVAAQGSFAMVSYDNTTVGVVDQHGGYEHNNWFDTVHAFVYGTSSTFPWDSTVKVNAFTAEGWRQHSDGYFYLDPVHLGTDFIVWSSDFTSIWSDPKKSLPLDHTGQDQPSGLRWAHLEATRGGWPFWYSTKTPHVVRDMIAHCSPGLATLDVSGKCGTEPSNNNSNSANDGEINPNAGQPVTLPGASMSFFEIPYAAGWSASSGGLGNMNFDDPATSHQHGCNQLAAYDLGNSLGANLLAARGGTAVFLRSTYTQTDPPGIAVCGGNFLFIRHMDGTFAVYFHMQPNGVLPKVGDVVHRGQVVGYVGQTGCASGPHVHFEALSWPSSDFASVRSLFRATNNNVTSNCYLPRFNDNFVSTNVQQ